MDDTAKNAHNEARNYPDDYPEDEMDDEDGDYPCYCQCGEEVHPYGSRLCPDCCEANDVSWEDDR